MNETTTERATVHRSKFGTYHANPAEDCAWTVNDTRGYIDGGPACDECDACECEDHEALDFDGGDECCGLSFAFVCLDGGDALCEDCATFIDIVDCDCDDECECGRDRSQHKGNTGATGPDGCQSFRLPNAPRSEAR